MSPNNYEQNVLILFCTKHLAKYYHFKFIIKFNSLFICHKLNSNTDYINFKEIEYILSQIRDIYSILHPVHTL